MKKPDKNSLLKDPEKLVNLFTLDASPSAFRDLIKTGQNRYLGWDKFKYQKTTDEFSIEDAWLFLQVKRGMGSEFTPIQTELGPYFKYAVTKEQQRMLSLIDSFGSGSFAADVSLPEGKQKERLIINGLIEEAINSSQLEGASTSRQVAKEMIQSGRKPKNESEIMILNNFFAMDKIESWSTRNLDESFLLELHSILTKDVLPENECGQFRTNEDNVVVSDPVTGEVFHKAPPVEFLKRQLSELYNFANYESEDDYLHPVIKAVFLHFWIGYLHPFTDGNGRTARVIFYWYLIKKDYWLFKYITTSKSIKASKKAYSEAYILTEQKDELDLGYFVQYILRTTLLSIEDFRGYLKRKMKEEKKLLENYSRNDLNERQVEILSSINKNNNSIDIESYRKRYSLVYESARRDLIELEDKGLLMKRKVGRKFVYELPRNT